MSVLNERNGSFMIKSSLKRMLSVLLLLAITLTVISCSTPSGRHYTSSDEGIKKATEKISKAEKKTSELANGIFDYSFFVSLKVGDKTLKMGTQNVLTFTDRGTENARIHRNNSFTSSQGGIALSTINEDHYYVGGVLHTTCYGANFKSGATEKEFWDYTEKSDISVNKDYLSTENFEKAEIFNCTSGETEIVCTKPNDKIKSGIYAFIGFTEDSGYVYNAKDVQLSALIDEDGRLMQQKLTFKVDYHPQYYPDQTMTYNGSFAFTVKTTGAEPAIPPTGVTYTGISDIKLLSAVTTDGYEKLSSFTSLDATYDEYIRVFDLTGEEMVYDVNVRFTEKLVGDKLYYGSIDSRSITAKSSKLNTATGIFNDDVGFHKRSYNKDTKKLTSEDKGKPTDSNEAMMSMVANTFSSHMLLASDIDNFRVYSDGSEQITFYMRLSSEAAKYYAVALMSVFAESSGDNINPDSIPSIYYTTNDVYVTIRKSDGCIIGHEVDFTAVIASSVTVYGNYKMTVSKTDDSVTVLTTQDWDSLGYTE